MKTLVGLFLVAPCACSDGPDVEASDQGKVCAFATDPDEGSGTVQSYEPGASVHLTVTYGDCLSACIENRVARCSATREGSTIVLHSDFSYDEPPPGEGCIALCDTLEARCDTPPLDAGSYTLEHGANELPLEVPSTAQPCF